MKKTKRRRSPGIAVRWAEKRLVDQHCLPPGSVLIDRVFDRGRGRFEDDDEPQIEGNFYLDDDETSAPDGRPEAMTALVGAAFEAATSSDLRRKLRHGQSLCVIVLVPTAAWVLPAADHFRRSFGDRWLQHTRSGPNWRAWKAHPARARCRPPCRPANPWWAFPPTSACFPGPWLAPRTSRSGSRLRPEPW